MKLFLELIQVAIGTRSALSSIPTLEEWEAMYLMSRKQALVGIAFYGIQQLPESQRPIIDLMYPWNEEVKAIEARNRQVDKRTKQLFNHLEHDGFHAMVLKGHSFGQYYPTVLRDRRTPGDIDVLMWPKEGTRRKDNGKMGNDQEAVIRYCLGLIPGKHVCYIHVDFPVFSDIPVEAHFRPSFLCNPFRNHQLQQWFEAQKPTLLTTDAYSFHEICCELHLFKHLFENGFGMRQLLDFYFLKKHQDSTLHETDKVPGFLSERFHRALNDLCVYLFEPETQDIEPNPERDFLMNEVLLGGNFGQYDPRIDHSGGSMRNAWEKLKHNFRLIGHYPSEVLWEPLFRLYHWYWRLKNHSDK